MGASADHASSPGEMTAMLKQVVNHYPSGSKQVRGTRLDKIVEAARSNSVAAIIRRLQAMAGKDLGKEPQRWLKEYPPAN